MNISEFNRNKPRKCHSFIKKLMKKYDYMITKMPIADDEDAVKVESAAEFRRDLEKLMKIFLTGD